MRPVVLLTGATGFLGTQCLARLIEAAPGTLHAVAGSRPGSAQPGVIWHQADLRRSEECYALIGKVRPTHLLHCAWVATPGIYSQTPENIAWVTGSAALADAFGRSGGERFVSLGSSAEYAPGDGPCHEDHTPILPATPYGKSKVGFWHVLQAAAQAHGFSAAWGRVFLPYGTGDNPKRLLPSLIGALDAQQEFPASAGEQLRDFIFSTDIADMLTRLMWVDDIGAFNIGTGRGVTVRRAMELTADLLGARHLLRIGARQMVAGEPMTLVADMTKTGRALGVLAPIQIEEGITRAIREFRSR